MSEVSSPPFVSPATQTSGARSRDGFVVLSRDVAGFIPTSDWEHFAGQVALGLLTTKVPLGKRLPSLSAGPGLAEELRQQTTRSGGFMLGEGWTRTLLVLGPKTYILLRHGPDALRIDREPPAELLARWPQVAMPRKVPSKVVWSVSMAAAGFALAGVVSWQLTDDSDFLVAGISFAVMAVLVLAGVFYSIRQMRFRAAGANATYTQTHARGSVPPP